MAVDTGMFKIDTCFTIGADDDLKLPYLWSVLALSANFTSRREENKPCHTIG